MNVVMKVGNSERKVNCNIPVNIGRLLATWLAVWIYSQMASTFAS